MQYFLAALSIFFNPCLTSITDFDTNIIGGGLANTIGMILQFLGKNVYFLNLFLNK